jgi:hypothetical protein
MNHKEIIDKLREDEHYYGKFGQQYLSNSNIKTLLSEPENLYKPIAKTPRYAYRWIFPHYYT